VKKLFVILLALPLLFASTSFAAPKKISVTPLKLIADAGRSIDFAGLVLSQNNIVIFGSSTQQLASTAFAKLLNLNLSPNFKAYLFLPY
jgi:ABC-type phosphate/phosphonate transport system permease subunit